MSIMVYADEKAERMAFINGKKYGGGRHIDGHYLLESITPQGAV